MSFHQLHHGDLPLVLPNARDVASALAFVDAGFPAIGTTSFGVAASSGRPDGGRSTKDATLALVRLLARMPGYLSIDIEDGYDDDPDRVVEFVAELGVAGINIEDSTDGTLIAPGQHAAKITAIKRRCPDLFVNARIDSYWLAQDATVEAILDRAAAYLAAGADGIFVPGATDPAELRELTGHIDAPVNVLVIPESSLTDLAALGVRRVSTGSLPYRRAIDAAVEVATGVRDGRPVPSATSYPQLQRRLIRFDQRH